MQKEYFAHTSSTHGDEKLIDHLLLTADLAERNGSFFQSGKVCRQLGLLHDVGKHTENFQMVLSGNKVKQDHAIVAALYYYNYGSITNKWLKKRLALIMAAHHSSLYTVEPLLCNYGSSAHHVVDSCYNINSEFREIRIDSPYHRHTHDEYKEIAVADSHEFQNIKDYINVNHLLLELTDLDYLPIKCMSMNERMFYVRMLLSCLVDADYSATIEYKESGYLQKYFYDNRFDIDLFMMQFDEYHEKLVAESSDSDMNQLRNVVYNFCAKNGSLKTGFLTLNAPTGTGKTLALMKFALEQAKQFQKRRIIIVLPFLSIIDQNGGIYKDIFGDDVVLIDDSQTDYTDESRIYSDRWSSPIIVTTSVKFFHTLFASKATDLRRLHNVADSVIVFDECQTLPSDVLNTSIEVLQSLTTYYNSTVLFSTATKPSYNYRNHVEQVTNPKSQRVLDIVRMQWSASEIMDNAQDVFDKYEVIKNTNVSCITDAVMDCNDLIEYYKNEIAVLYIFNTVKHAKTMYEQMIDAYGDDGCYMITSNFCSVDKLHIIDEVNQKLRNGEFVRLVATQCIEAGVDFDFPCGAREYAPLDSVIQSAGRVNRNGKYNGKFLVFKYVDSGLRECPSASYYNASRITRKLAEQNHGLDFYDIAFMDSYFKELYRSPQYRDDLKSLYHSIFYDNYDGVKNDYKIIDSKSQAIMLVKPLWYDASEFNYCVQKIKDNGFVITKMLMRKLSKYTVSIDCNGNVKPNDFGTQLSIKVGRNECLINWFLVEDSNFYNKMGFDKRCHV